MEIDLFRLFHGATDDEGTNVLSDFSKARTEPSSPFLLSEHDFHPSARMPVLYVNAPLNDTHHYSHAHSHIGYLMSLKNTNLPYSSGRSSSSPPSAVAYPRTVTGTCYT